MFVSFVGSPCSGKTTTSSMLFSKLKQSGLPVESLGEYARVYIAKKMLQCKSNGTPFALTDEDQWNIMQTQGEWECILDASLATVPGGLVISDTSSLNSLLYMSKEFRESPDVKAFTRGLVKHSALVFYSKPVDLPAYSLAPDPNRVHTPAQSDAIDKAIPEFLKEIGADSYILLTGGMEARLARAYQAVNARLEYVFKQHETKKAV
jgi:hypothetical protein